MDAVSKNFITLQSEGARITRGLHQYELALREWYIGGEWLALSHLYMAVETLTKSVIRKTLADLDISEEELAQRLDVVTNDPERPGWRKVLEERARRQLVFHGDTDTYATAKGASDGIEHGFMEIDEACAE